MLRTDDAGRRTPDNGRWTLDDGPSAPYYKLTGELKTGEYKAIPQEENPPTGGRSGLEPLTSCIPECHH